MNFLSRILSAEYAKDNILVQLVTPNQVETKLVGSMLEPKVAVNAHDYVKYALKAVGTEQETSAHPKHKLINNISVWLRNWLPEEPFFKLTLNALVKARANYDKKVKQQN
jgi:short-subunit dehydrogenase